MSTKPTAPIDGRLIRFPSLRISRKAWRKFHVWMGFSLGIIWALQGLTGALLVFHREFDVIGARVIDQDTSLSASKLIAAGEAITGRPIERLNAAGFDTRIVEARYRDADGEAMGLLLNRADGSVVKLQERDPDIPTTGSFWRWIMRLHVSLVAGDTGKIIVGITGTLLLLMLATGLKIAWPANGKWHPVFQIAKWKSVPQRNYGWHRLTGILTFVGMLIFTITGVYMVTTHTLMPLFGRHDPYEMIVMTHGWPGTPDAIGPDRALALAQREFPDGQFVNLQTPVESPGVYTVRMLRPCELRGWAGRATVVLDSETGQKIARYDPCATSILNMLDDAAYPLHTGEAGGIVGRLLTVLTGFGLLVLFILGLRSWNSRRRKRHL